MNKSLQSITLPSRESLSRILLMTILLFNVLVVHVFGAASMIGKRYVTGYRYPDATTTSSTSTSIIRNIYHRPNLNVNVKASSCSTKRVVTSSSSSSSNSIAAAASNDSINLWNFRSISTWNTPKNRRTRRTRYNNNNINNNKNNGGVVGPNSTEFVRRKQKQVEYKNTNNDYDRAIDEYNDRPPTAEEMRAQLGPIGLLVANAVEVGMTTAGSYMSGGIFGYLIGGTMATPTLFKRSELAKDITIQQQASQNNALREFQKRMGNMNSKAVMQAKSWAKLSAAFSGFHAFARVCRGGKEDKWNSIIGSAFTGAYLSREAGPQAMLTGASTYAGFTLVLDSFFGGSGRGGEGSKSEWSDFQDQPLQKADDRGY